MSISKTLKFGMTGATLLVAQMVMAEQIVDISFGAPLYCANERKSILYTATSFNKDSFTKVTDLAYFTDGYANIPVSNFYSAREYKIDRNTLTVVLAILAGSNVLDYGPQKTGDLSNCKVTLEAGWREKLKVVGDVQIYESSDFEAV